MEKIKLIAIDIGGTLLTDNNEVSKENIEIIKNVKKAGIKIALITARMYSSTKYISNLIDADYGIFGNGSVVMELKSEKIIKYDYLSKNDVKKLIDFSKEEKLYAHISRLFVELSDENKYFALKHNILNNNYPKKLKSNILVVNNLKYYCEKHTDIVKIILVSEKNMDLIVNKINNIFSNLYITEYNKNLYEYAIDKTINYIEIGNNYSEKSEGLDCLISKMKINSDAVLVIGDGKNDIEMIKKFNNSACPLNADNEVKQYVKYVSNKTNSQSAVSDIIKKFVKECR